jgi:hypothetical protein
MKILRFLGSGFLRSSNAWKGILTIWCFSLILAGLAGLPAKAGMKSILGSSMITELLKDGFNYEAFVWPGSGSGPLVSAFSSAVILLFLVGFLMNVFLNGGLFSILKSGNEKPFAKQFFTGCSTNFWSFLIITVMVSLMILFTGFIIVGVPTLIASASGNSPDVQIVKSLKISGLIFILILPVFLLVADYARAWKTSNPASGSFRSIGRGFRHAFRYFFSSYPVMIVILLVSALVLFMVYSVYAGFTPTSGGGILLLFLLLQLLFIIKVATRSWRYGSVTAMLEDHLTPNMEQ